MKYKDFSSLLIYLKKNLDFPYPVHVKRTKIAKDLDGCCVFTKKKTFLIKIQDCLAEHAAIDTLLHEMGHALAWDKEKDVHGVLWGKAYSVVYRTFLQWLEK